MAGTLSVGLSLRYLKKANALSSLIQHFYFYCKTPVMRPATHFNPSVKCCSITHQAGLGTEDDGPYVPRRTLMYVPGHDLKKLMKIPHLNVDCAVLECEDGVAINMKEQARKNIKEVLKNLRADGVDIALRVNSVSSNLMKSDVNGIIGDDLGDPLELESLPHTILLPKVDSVEDLIAFTDTLKHAKLDRNYVPYLLTYVESAQGLLNIKDVLSEANNLTKEGNFKIDGVVFGSDDFCADIGAERTRDAKELVYARQKIVTIAKAFRIQAIDMVHVDIHDKEGLKTLSEQGARKGFTGKQVIHPGQVSIVEAAFTPSKARVEWATELIKGFEEHQSQGEGAFTFRGQMIDMPLLRQAKNVLSIVKNVHKS